MAISDETWRRNTFELPRRLSAIDRTGHDDGIREAMFVVWTALATASGTIKHLYSAVREVDILASAADHDLSTSDFGLSFAGDEPNGALVGRLASCLRAMEIEFTSGDLGSRPTDPESWRVGLGDESAYLVPMGRKAWRTARDPARDTRPFDQRGVLRVRFIPTIVDGASVRLKIADRLDGPDVSRFGAVLFPGATFECDETDTTFVVTAVHIPNSSGIIEDACRSAHSPPCLAAVFPELTIDPQSRDAIRTQLSKKPWLSPGDLPQAPGFVVAGSWHELDGDTRYNIATVFDGYGDVLLRHRKRFAYKDSEGRFEDIIGGDEFAVLVLPGALFAFGICLDFCHRCFSTPYGELDVDFVIVPSCGDGKTMTSHIRTASDLHNRRGTRSFVVQQAYPVEKSVGYVLDPDGQPTTRTTNDLLRNDPWSIFSC